MAQRSIIIATLAAALVVGGWALAQSQPDPEPIPLPPLTAPPAAPPPVAQPETPDQGIDLIERGAGILLRGLLNEVAPQMDAMSRDMADALALMGPALSDLSVLVDDIGNYQTPERLENGDIIIRRKPGAPPAPPVGEGLRQFTQPDGPALPAPVQPDLPLNPDQTPLEL
ncbi:MAG: hypothetical protein Q4G14_09270 [Paracoccus sp. (in: a-proteobacteria)]|uniref:hypothetical protein n=1 Tax=Paracoccus sp. TaxID=267 RepID=UPI0026E0EA79|nr:hypothetical protein [Paracoccus sp. (in: a-proteobacteria)]MDO5613415.1 hypothetical protein [Paracoccus sp. (in: a-proteobacteria)]